MLLLRKWGDFDSYHNANTMHGCWPTHAKNISHVLVEENKFGFQIWLKKINAEKKQREGLTVYLYELGEGPWTTNTRKLAIVI
jgi:hypothetical protein